MKYPLFATEHALEFLQLEAHMLFEYLQKMQIPLITFPRRDLNLDPSFVQVAYEGLTQK